MAETDDPCRDDSACGDDVADLRLQCPRRGHLQRGRSAEALRPDAAEAEEAGGRDGPVIHLDPVRDFAREHRAEHQTESPVEPRRGHREYRDESHGAARRRWPRRDDAYHADHRRGRSQHMTGDDHERHLQREGDKVPETPAPGVDDLAGAGRRQRKRRRRRPPAWRAARR